MRALSKFPFGLGLILALFFVLSAGVLDGQVPPEREEIAARRFALIIGANNGGSGRTTLRYAVSDARAFGDVLRELGDVRPEDAVFLEQPDRAVVLRELQALGSRLDRARPRLRRTEVLFYYSGHSDEESILLGNERITYPELRAAINGLNADVRIGILDSCASGALTVARGVIKRSPFLLDEAYDMKGFAFLTSSSADEASQESRRLQGSFFTHNLLSALRGAADRNMDGRISLSEAYQFAFDETLAQTEKTSGGPQHPNYHIEMSGTGDVIITDITKSAALLTFKGDVAGRIFIHNRAYTLIAELAKPAGRDITIGLEEGFYRLTAVSDNAVYETEITLKKGEPQEIGRSGFERVGKVPTRARGSRTYIPPFGPRGTPKWQVDVFGGAARTEPPDLNQRPLLDQSLIDSLNDMYSYYRQTGVVSFYQSDLGESLRPLKFSYSYGVRARRSLKSWLSLSLGVSGLTGRSSMAATNRFTVIETSGRQYVDQYDIEEYILGIQAWIPTVSLHAGVNLFRDLRLEARLGGGPLFASCRYRKQTSVAPVSDLGQLLDDVYSSRLEEKGSGTGWSWDGGVVAQLALGRSLSLIFEASYAFRRLDRLSGPGEAVTSDGTNDKWNGGWEMKSFFEADPWGIYALEFPSNYWPESEMPRRVRNFVLDLSGFELKLGFSFRL
jgi:hypothetical protein